MSLPRQFLRFSGVGVIAAISHFAVLIALVESAGAAPVPAALAAFIAGAVTSYILNRRFTFATDRSHQHAVPRFAIVAGGGFLLTGLAMHVLIVRFGVHYVAAQIVTTLVVLLWTFTLNRNWTFGGRSDAS